jgi:hypothetical protein
MGPIAILYPIYILGCAYVRRMNYLVMSARGHPVCLIQAAPGHLVKPGPDITGAFLDSPPPELVSLHAMMHRYIRVSKGRGIAREQS